jgi:hypothetical protein
VPISGIQLSDWLHRSDRVVQTAAKLVLEPIFEAARARRRSFSQYWQETAMTRPIVVATSVSDSD